MIEEWSHTDIAGDESEHYGDGRVEFEIPADDIIEVYPVLDDFKDIDNSLFES